jgi:hypothetical protein
MMTKMLARAILCAIVLFGVPALMSAETVTIPVSADTWISSVGKEANTNGGKAGKIKLKGYQEFGLLDFDVSALKGKKITAATLHVAPAGGLKHSPPARGTDLRWFTVSTISSPWSEGGGSGYTIDSGATFLESSFETAPWSYPGSTLNDVTLGNGNTLRCDVDAGEPRDGWMVIPLDKRLVEALVAKASHGLMLMDGHILIAGNAYISSREGGKAPFLTVTVEGTDTQAPAVPTGLAIEPQPLDASTRTGAAKISLVAPEDAFAYDLKLNDKPLPRWQTPFPAKAGSTQTFTLLNLEAGKPFKLEVAAVDAAGNASAFASASGQASDKIKVPALPESPWQPLGGAVPAVEGEFKVWAFPEICKLNPLTGKIALEQGMEFASRLNTVWDAGTQTVRVAAARGEIAGFQLALELAGDTPKSLDFTLVGLDEFKARKWRTWFVKAGDAWQAEYALPMKDGEALQLPAEDNKIPGQRAAVVAVDLIVPADMKPGEYSGTIHVTITNTIAVVPLNVKVQVYDTQIPAEMNFIPELNCYGGPLGEAGSAEFFDAFRLSHYLRTAINRVPHGHSGTTHADWIPKTDDKGHVTDWSGFDRNLGPLLDGSAFKDNPRAGVPTPVLYLPFNESYPLPFAANYKPGDNVPLVGKDWKARHDILAKPPEESFSQAYKDAFINCVGEFVKHYEEKGWTRTLAEGFNNNKFFYGKRPLLDAAGKQVVKDGVKQFEPAMTGTAWTLDEPATWLDWQGLTFYSRLFHEGSKNARTAKFVYRADISRPNIQGSVMDGKIEVMVVNGGMVANMMPQMREHKRRMPAKLFLYGACNNLDRANHNTTAWLLKAYVSECDGVMPWQSIGGDDAFEKGDNMDARGVAPNGNMLIVNGKRFGVNAVAGFRAHAFRNGAQIAELLRLLEKKNNWSRAHSAALVGQLIPMSVEFRQSFNDAAAGLSFDNLNGDQFVRLKEGILLLLAK